MQFARGDRVAYWMRGVRYEGEVVDQLGVIIFEDNDHPAPLYMLKTEHGVRVKGGDELHPISPSSPR